MNKKEESSFCVLIVDDERAMCELLKESLVDQYDVSIIHNGSDACDLIDKRHYDIYVIDLKLPDMSGVDVLSYAKKKDEYCEVIIVTGYGSVDSASWAINHGASSYLIKPITLDDFYRQLERCVANRAFHLQSIQSINESSRVSPEVQTHINDITSLYSLSRKLLISLDLPELIQIVLEDVTRRMSSALSMLCIQFLQFSEVFAMPYGKEVTQEQVREKLNTFSKEIFGPFSKKEIEEKTVSISVFPPYGGNGGKDTTDAHCLCIPLTTGGKDLGSLVLFLPKQLTRDSHEYYFLHVYTSVISSIMHHAYTDVYAQLQAKTDALTGIANYRLFADTLSREIARANRCRGIFSVIMIDIDDFKKINDTHGHPVGNEVIKHLCNTVQRTMRKSDLFARYGGEEFVILLPDTDLHGAQIFAQRLRVLIEEAEYCAEDLKVNYTASIGVARYNGDTPRRDDELISQVDGALYTSKHEGKNRVTVAQ